MSDWNRKNEAGLREKRCETPSAHPPHEWGKRHMKWCLGRRAHTNTMIGKAGTTR